MDALRESTGFLGTGASLLADVTLVAYLLLIVPAMIGGYVTARRKKHRPHHQWLMIIVTVLNWFLILFLMLTTYRLDVAQNFLAQPGSPRYLVPTVHALLGIPAQILATFLVVRMAVEDTQVARARRRGETEIARYWFKRAKPVMQLTLALWMVTALFGVVTYLVRYDVLPAVAQGRSAGAPVVTPDVVPPLATDELSGADDF